MTIQDLQLPHLIPLKTQGSHATYSIEPLEPGYGTTVGHTLRQVLLSHLPGVAISSLRIKGAQQGTTELPGVEEDIDELILNVKQVRLRVLAGGRMPISLHLDVTGEQQVTAADLLLPDFVEVLTPNVHLVTLTTATAHLVLDLEVTRGKGYVPTEPTTSSLPGIFPVDAMYTPVRQVNISMEHTRLGQQTNYDRIVLDLWTDGSITPEEAMLQGADLLVQQLSVLSTYTPNALVEQEAPSSQLRIPQEMFALPLDTLSLSVRTFNSLKRNNIATVGQVLEMSEDALRALRNVGDKSLIELQEQLRDYLPSSQEEE